MYTKQSRH